MSCLPSQKLKVWQNEVGRRCSWSGRRSSISFYLLFATLHRIVLLFAVYLRYIIEEILRMNFLLLFLTFRNNNNNKYTIFWSISIFHVPRTIRRARMTTNTVRILCLWRTQIFRWWWDARLPRERRQETYWVLSLSLSTRINWKKYAFFLINNFRTAEKNDYYTLFSRSRSVYEWKNLISYLQLEPFFLPPFW